MRRRPGSQMQQNMRRLVEDAEQQYLQIKAENLPRFLPKRFEPGNQRYGIPANSRQTQQAKVRRGRPPIPLVDTGRLARAVRFARWVVTTAGNLTTRLPDYFRRVQAEYNVLGLTLQERRQLLDELRRRLRSRR